MKFDNENGFIITNKRTCISLGYYTETQAKKIIEKLQDETFLHFDIKFNNMGVNSTILISTWRECTHEELYNMFVYACLCKLAEL